MPRVTKEKMKFLIDNGAFPPRHQRGCERNYLRILPRQFAARGMEIDEIKMRIEVIGQVIKCTCKK